MTTTITSNINNGSNSKRSPPLHELNDTAARPVSTFLSPTSELKDRFRAQAYARHERSKRSPFVQRAYRRFVRTHPELSHCGLARCLPVQRFRPTHYSQQQRHLPAFSYLKDWLLKKNRPQATAGRNSLLRSRQRRQPLEELLRPRTRRRCPKQQTHTNSLYQQSQAFKVMGAGVWKDPPKRPLVKRIRRRQR
ncbi:Histone methyltransferase [Globisporangium polare]